MKITILPSNLINQHFIFWIKQGFIKITYHPMPSEVDYYLNGK